MGRGRRSRRSASSSASRTVAVRTTALSPSTPGPGSLFPRARRSATCTVPAGLPSAGPGPATPVVDSPHVAPSSARTPCAMAVATAGSTVPTALDEARRDAEQRDLHRRGIRDDAAEQDDGCARACRPRWRRAGPPSGTPRRRGSHRARSSSATSRPPAGRPSPPGHRLPGPAAPRGTDVSRDRDVRRGRRPTALRAAPPRRGPRARRPARRDAAACARSSRAAGRP